MDISLIADPITLATQQQGLGFAISLLHRQNISNTNLQTSAVIFDAIAPPPVKFSSRKTIRRSLLRKKRRIRRRSYSGGESEDGGEDFGFLGGDGDGPFGGGGGGGNWSGGGRGWNFDKFGGHNWDESSSWSSSSKFAYGFVYEVIYWIALSNCLHFAFEKVARIMADSERAKGPMRLASVC
ncbi:uncharacterized protein LOC8278776 [Ricinus communis]|uniref:Uncharacterized protein n=1 Tax=Ricinus communis TaxID=3988 RepID=B9RTA3_RICCO|nr:uncharacterized protein LOC8278776 [Ricinus communis]EEF45586.1 conserved hypothetical protein [Ricinus communis]|eukprot:XP_002516972.1 uncharacterized protein LOC8278776 [Ricinus communis]